MSRYERVVSSIEEEYGNVVAERVKDYYDDNDVDFINTLSDVEAEDYIRNDLNQVLLYMDLAEETSALA
jgi:hypothetical protein